MSKKSDYKKTLDKLAHALRREPMSAKAIAIAFGCCRPTAYQRIASLRQRGDKVYEIEQKEEGVTGPASRAYGIPTVVSR